MFIMIADETNKEESTEATFFIYGGLIYKHDVFQDLHYGIKRIREDAGFKSSDTYKHTSHCRPEYVTQEDFSKSKQDVIQLISDSECKFLLYLIHHGILKDKDWEKTYSNALNTILSRYDIFLERNSSYGISLIDNLPISGKEKVLRGKFQQGLTFENKQTINLKHIYLYGSITDNTSHILSGMDIVLGTFRYWVNKLYQLNLKFDSDVEQENEKLCRELMSSILPMTNLGFQYKTEVYGNLAGLMIRPKDIKSVEIEGDYESLNIFLDNFMG